MPFGRVREARKDDSRLALYFSCMRNRKVRRVNRRKRDSVYMNEQNTVVGKNSAVRTLFFMLLFKDLVRRYRTYEDNIKVHELKSKLKISIRKRLCVIKKVIRRMEGKSGKNAQFGCTEEGYQYWAIPR